MVVVEDEAVEDGGDTERLRRVLLESLAASGVTHVLRDADLATLVRAVVTNLG